MFLKSKISDPREMQIALSRQFLAIYFFMENLTPLSTYRFSITAVYFSEPLLKSTSLKSTSGEILNVTVILKNMNSKPLFTKKTLTQNQVDSGRHKLHQQF